MKLWVKEVIPTVPEAPRYYDTARVGVSLVIVRIELLVLDRMKEPYPHDEVVEVSITNNAPEYIEL